MENTAPKWVTIAGVVLLLWNAIGVCMFALDMMKTPADLAALPQDQQALWAQMPIWGWFGYGLSTIAGLLGALGIVMKKRWAALLALLSLIGFILNFIPAFVLSKGVDVWQPKFLGLPILILVLVLFMLWLARKGNSKGWNS